MREYRKKNGRNDRNDRNVDGRIICNGCGKVITVRSGMPLEGVCSVRQVWGYPSEKDGTTDSFDLCEECYDRITKTFQIPPARTEQTELL